MDICIKRNNHIELPMWLDKFIFEKLDAKYCRSNSDMTVIDWDKSDVLNYLGTYFPRSYAESYCILKKYFVNNISYTASKEEISFFDFGCGTGGEIIGLMSVLAELFPNLKKINIVALDGNQHALRLYEKVLNRFMEQYHIEINSNSAAIKIDDFYDLSILDSILNKKFDIIMSFKAICEFVTKDCFERHNAYKHIVKTFMPNLKDDGIILLDDITSYNNVSKEWLPIMMDKGICDAGGLIVGRNEGYNQNFKISHSRKQNDLSKVVWRILKK